MQKKVQGGRNEACFNCRATVFLLQRYTLYSIKREFASKSYDILANK